MLFTRREERLSLTESDGIAEKPDAVDEAVSQQFLILPPLPCFSFLTASGSAPFSNSEGFQSSFFNVVDATYFGVN